MCVFFNNYEKMWQQQLESFPLPQPQRRCHRFFLVVKFKRKTGSESTPGAKQIQSRRVADWKWPLITPVSSRDMNLTSFPFTRPMEVIRVDHRHPLIYTSKMSGWRCESSVEAEELSGVKGRLEDDEVLCISKTEHTACLGICKLVS